MSAYDGTAAGLQALAGDTVAALAAEAVLLRADEARLLDLVGRYTIAAAELRASLDSSDRHAADQAAGLLWAVLADARNIL